MSKKVLALVLVLAMCMMVVAGCSGEKAADKGEAAGERTTFTVGFDAEFPPYGFIDDNGEYDGFDLALAEEVCARKGWEFNAQAINWDAKDSELASGNIDCIWNGFTKSEDRVDDYSWSDAYVDNSIVMVVRSDSGIKSLADLEGKSVMTQAGSSALTALEENTELSDTFGELLECADYNVAFMELESGTVDALAADIGVATYQLGLQGDSYTILDEKVASEEYAIGFLKGNDALRDEVWEVVLEMAEDGTMEKIAQNYVEKGLVIENLCLLNK